MVTLRADQTSLSEGSPELQPKEYTQTCVNLINANLCDNFFEMLSRGRVRLRTPSQQRSPTTDEVWEGWRPLFVPWNWGFFRLPGVRDQSHLWIGLGPPHAGEKIRQGGCVH